MSTINWTLTVGGTSFTSITQSLSFNFGRTSYFDTSTGTTCTFTVRNNTGQAANISEGDQIVVDHRVDQPVQNTVRAAFAQAAVGREAATQGAERITCGLLEAHDEARLPHDRQRLDHDRLVVFGRSWL